MDMFHRAPARLAEDAGATRAIIPGIASRQKIVESERVDLGVLMRVADARSGVDAAVQKAGSRRRPADAPGRAGQDAGLRDAGFHRTGEWQRA